LKEQEKPHKPLDGQLSVQEQNPGPAEHKAGVLTTTLFQYSTSPFST